MYRPIYRSKTLEVPSLRQYNPKNKESGVWCGRTSAAMIHNYYKLLAGEPIIINQHSRRPYEFVFEDKLGELAYKGNLRYALEYIIESSRRGHWTRPKDKARAKIWVEEGRQQDWVRVELFELGGRPAKLAENQILDILAPALEAIDLNNPVLIYTGISADDRAPHHIMVMSGYRFGGNGLELLIDDPGGTGWKRRKGKRKQSKPIGLIGKGVVPVEFTDEQLDAYPQHGRRFWLRADTFFSSNFFSKKTKDGRDDLFCDYYDFQNKKWVRTYGARMTFNRVTQSPAERASSEAWLQLPYNEDQRYTGKEIERFWERIRAVPSPYPLGLNRTWHDGVHITASPKVYRGDEAFAFAPGRAVLARQSKREDGELDASFMLVQHHFDPETYDVVDPAKVKDLSGLVAFYSLYMHLSEPLDAQRGADWVRRFYAHKPKLAKLRKWNSKGEACQLGLVERSDAGDVLVVVETSDLNAPREFDDDGETDPEDPVIEKSDLKVNGEAACFIPVGKQNTNAKRWKRGRPTAIKLGNRKLGYLNPFSPLNPAAPAVIKTAKKTDKRAIAKLTNNKLTVLLEENGGAWVAVSGGNAPGIILDDHDTEVSRDLAKGSPLMFTDPTVTLGLHTVRGKKGRYFREKYRSDTLKLTAAGDRSFIVDEIAKTSGKWRLWPELVPCVFLTGAEKKKLDAKLSGQEDSRALLERLESGQSALFSLLVATSRTSKGQKRLRGWLLNSDGTVQANPDYRHKDDHFPVCSKPYRGWCKVDVQPDRRFVVVDSYVRKNRPWALVEARLLCAESELEDNKKTVDEAQGKLDTWNELDRKLQTARDDGSVVDLDGWQPYTLLKWESVGFMGVLSAKHQGVHFEVFAGKHMLEESDWKQSWRVVKDPAKNDLLKQDFLTRTLKKLCEGQIGKSGHAAAKLVAKAEDGVVRRKDWWDFYVHHAHMLSSLVCSHPSEWEIDWAGQLDGEVAKSTQDPDEIKKQLARLRIWTDGMKLEGIDGDPFFYHPIRFIEWLSTGLNVCFINRHDKKPTVKLLLPSRGNSDLEPHQTEVPGGKGKHPPVYRYRSIPGVRRTSLEGHLELGGVDTTKPKVPVQVRRGQVLAIDLVHPDVSLDYVSDAQRGDHFLVPIEHASSWEEREDYEAFLLPDGGGLPELDYSSVSVDLLVRYNVELPTSIEVELDNTAFEITRYRLSGACWKSEPSDKAYEQGSFPGNKVTVSPKPLDSAPQYVTSYSELSLQLELTEKGQWGQEGTLSIKVSGGDLSAPVSEQLPIKTRKQINAGMVGEDVAKLQVYLSQIIAGMPCYRFHGIAPKGALIEWTGHNGKGIAIDGMYTRPQLGGEKTKLPPQLGVALWFFISAFCDDDDWELATISHSDARGGDVKPLSLGAKGTPERQLAAVAMAAHVDERAKKGKARCPVVDQALLAEIIKRFRSPHILQPVKLSVDKLQESDLGPLSSKDKEQNINWARTSGRQLRRFERDRV